MCNDEALGVADGGQTVSEFLQEGTPFGIVAAVNTVMLTVASVFCGVCIASAMSGAAKSFAAWDFGGGSADGGKKTTMMTTTRTKIKIKSIQSINQSTLYYIIQGALLLIIIYNL